MARVPIVMRADGSVSAMKATDLKEVAERDRRIRQLEELNRVLSTEVDRMRPVVEAAQVLIVSLRRHGPASWSGSEELLERRVGEYEASKPK